MPTFLSDPSNGFYVILFVLVIGAIGLWLKKRDRNGQITAVIAVAVFALFVLLDRMFESPREQVVRKTEEMSAAVNARDEAKFLSHVSDGFEYKSMKKADIKKIVDLAKQYDVLTVVWEFDRSKVVETKDGIEIVFDAKGELKTGEPMFRHFKAKFTKDADGQYRLRSLTPFNYAAKAQEDPIPGL